MGDFLNEDIKKEQVPIEPLDVMEPKMLINDPLQVIYINEACEEKILEEKDSVQAKEYEKAKADYPGYVTRLRRLPVTIDFMKRYSLLTHDSFMLDLIKRKEDLLRSGGDQYEVNALYAFANMFLARNPQCKNVFKMTRKMDEYEKAHPEMKTKDSQN